jgi:hypothetical protein
VEEYLMDRKIHYVVGTAFAISSGLLYTGLLYTIERFIAYYSWIGQMNAHTGNFPTYPEMPGFFSNIFVPIFFLIGVILIATGYRKK